MATGGAQIGAVGTAAATVTPQTKPHDNAVQILSGQGLSKILFRFGESVDEALFFSVRSFFSKSFVK